MQSEFGSACKDAMSATLCVELSNVASVREWTSRNDSDRWSGQATSADRTGEVFGRRVAERREARHVRATSGADMCRGSVDDVGMKIRMFENVLGNWCGKIGDQLEEFGLKHIRDGSPRSGVPTEPRCSKGRRTTDRRNDESRFLRLLLGKPWKSACSVFVVMGGWELDVYTAAVDEERAGRVRWQSFQRRDVPDYLQPLEPGLYPGRHHTFGIVLLRTWNFQEIVWRQMLEEPTIWLRVLQQILRK